MQKIMTQKNKIESVNASSMVVFPFEFKTNSFQSNSEAINYFKRSIETITLQSNNEIIDSSKYHNFISNYISKQGEENDLSFLKLFPIDLSKLKVKNTENTSISFASQFINIQLTIGETPILIKIDTINIVINEIAQLGYFIFKIDYLQSQSNILQLLAQIDFYRFFQPQEILNKKNELKPQFAIKAYKEKRIDKEGNLSIITNYYSLYGIIETYFSFLLQNSQFIYKKPLMLHLLLNDEFYKSDYELENKCYAVLRIPSKQSDINDNPSSHNRDVKVYKPDVNISFCAMLEGAVIIDSSVTNNNSIDLVNKYLPAFILALNQREVMLKTAKDISQFSYKDLNSENKNVLINLTELRKRLNLIQLKQIFYNISLNNEVEMFFEQLQNKFGIKTLLEDNKTSIEAIHDILENERSDFEEAAQKKRDDNLSFVLSLLGLFGGASAVIDVCNFYSDASNNPFWWLPIIFIAITAGLIVRFYKFK